ncbi:major intrinsically disordered NOTCH2-binding receptor 1-like [Rhinatrema bivittatum]|uniref:major intrinsically disordered NOTCH2-binding receptor 1-like n=1 Tax=Rhinatrema bivittatum TaxID=194408 RepID=UPI00112E854E|nr:major intrinsically disordered NOTCH2-binding receptor 1-like [Rhinatrema bivittatum]
MEESHSSLGAPTCSLSVHLTKQLEGNMDLSVLPNNNHPEKFLRLDVKNLMMNTAFLQARQWHNRVYLQRQKRNLTEPTDLESGGNSPAFIDKALSKHITPVTLKSTIKSNPLYQDTGICDGWEERKKQPSWTIQDYDKQSVHPNLSNYMKENPNDLQYWLEDIYTPGYDSLLKKKEKEKKHSKYCRIALVVVFAVCVLIATVTVSILFTDLKKNTATFSITHYSRENMKMPKKQNFERNPNITYMITVMDLDFRHP